MLCEKPLVLLLAACLALVVALVEASERQPHLELHRELRKRNAASTDPSELNGKTFDYVVIGGGQAGLVVASRLSENPDVSVAVIEAGTSGTAKNESEKINIPAANLYNSPGKTYMNWKYNTVKQPQLNDRVTSCPRGKVLGGSSAINGLYYVRHSVGEQDAWGKIVDDKELWGWNNMYRAMKKSETFTEPKSSVADVDRIVADPNSHGKDGPIHASWPAVPFECTGAFINASVDVAAPFANDPYAGTNLGTYVATSNINPTNWTRSFSRTGYYDPIVYRSNLHVLTQHLVTKINFDKSGKQLKATEVKFKSSPDSDEYTVKVGREAIISGGAINTPQILQLSGIGEKGFLKSKGIDAVLNLPGVGYNLQDHVSGGVEWQPKDTTKLPPQDLKQSKEVNSYTNSAVAYLNGSQVMKDQWGTYLDQVKGNKSKAVNALPAPDSVKKGYDLTYQTVLDTIQNQIATMEILFSTAFGKIQVQAALQHAFSRGTVMINSKDPFEPPNIDPRYLEQESDMFMLREGFKVARSIGEAAPLNSYLEKETNPGKDVSSDSDWENFIRGRVQTEFHISGTAVMLPKDKGGVVDKNLMVYGTSNLRVIDASVVPFVVSSHFMSLVYGLAEIGSEIVLDSYKNSNGNNNRNGGGNSNNKDGASSGNNNNNNNNGDSKNDNKSDSSSNKNDDGKNDNNSNQNSQPNSGSKASKDGDASSNSRDAASSVHMSNLLLSLMVSALMAFTTVYISL